MKLEELIQAGLTEDQAKKVMELHKKAIDGNFVPKQTFEAERDKVKTANDTIAERDKQITELGKFKGTAEELQKRVDKLTEDNANAKTEYDNKIKDMEETTAIRLSIADTVYSADDVISKLDRSKITFEDGKVKAGLVEQMDAIKKASPHYFKPDQKGAGGGLPAGWKPFGTPPGESNGAGAVDSAAEFGKNLAKAQSQGISSTQKAADIYFK